jgi:hypothetical protein
VKNYPDGIGTYAIYTPAYQLNCVLRLGNKFDLYVWKSAIGTKAVRDPPRTPCILLSLEQGFPNWWVGTHWWLASRFVVDREKFLKCDFLIIY